MKHLTDEEIIDFVSMSTLDDASLKNAAYVTGHITECAECLRRVRAFQMLCDEFAAEKERAEAQSEEHGTKSKSKTAKM